MTQTDGIAGAGTGVSGPFTALSLRVASPPGLPMAGVAHIIDQVTSLLFLGAAIDYGRRGESDRAFANHFATMTMNTHAPIETFERARDELRHSVYEQVAVARLGYGSPFDVLLTVPGEVFESITAGALALRGTIYLMSRWQSYRLQKAKTDVEVAVWQAVREHVPVSWRLQELILGKDVAEASRVVESTSTATISQSIELEPPTPGEEEGQTGS